MSSVWSCPVCHQPCNSQEEAIDHCRGRAVGATYHCRTCGAPVNTLNEVVTHCQHSWNSKTCPVCRGTRFNAGRMCTECSGTGKVRF